MYIRIVCYEICFNSNVPPLKNLQFREIIFSTVILYCILCVFLVFFTSFLTFSPPLPTSCLFSHRLLSFILYGCLLLSSGSLPSSVFVNFHCGIFVNAGHF